MYRRDTALAAIACGVIVLLLALSGCGSDGNPQNDTGNPQNDTVQGFLDALIDGDGDKACSYLTDSGKGSLAYEVAGNAAATGNCPSLAVRYADRLGSKNLDRLANTTFKATDKNDPEPNLHPDGDLAQDPGVSVVKVGDTWKIGLVPLFGEFE
jgi:hypothetical protein